MHFPDRGAYSSPYATCMATPLEGEDMTRLYSEKGETPVPAADICQSICLTVSANPPSTTSTRPIKRRGRVPTQLIIAITSRRKPASPLPGVDTQLYGLCCQCFNLNRWWFSQSHLPLEVRFSGHVLAKWLCSRLLTIICVFIADRIL